MNDFNYYIDNKYNSNITKILFEDDLISKYNIKELDNEDLKGLNDLYFKYDDYKNLIMEILINRNLVKIPSFKFDEFLQYKNNLNLEKIQDYFLINGCLCLKKNEKTFYNVINCKTYKI